MESMRRIKNRKREGGVSRRTSPGDDDVTNPIVSAFKKGGQVLSVSPHGASPLIILLSPDYQETDTNNCDDQTTPEPEG